TRVTTPSGAPSTCPSACTSSHISTRRGSGGFGAKLGVRISSRRTTTPVRITAQPTRIYVAARSARDREDIELSLPEKRVGIPRLYRHRPIARLDGSTLPFHRAS